ncbi:PPR repeat [Geosmithia morbida]|uniref:PPR repeat n=1 Tax=Geosmithia morbida TaxID=1094350 RepID=A0A9P5D0Y8_9HYPO|nr:PPR repeat [Geosmithia morbida]KAF4123258.1 PPR repeat [Geosmithia morbida]
MVRSLLACAARLPRAAFVSWVPFGARRGPVAVLPRTARILDVRLFANAVGNTLPAPEAADVPRTLEKSGDDDADVAEKRSKDRLQAVVKKHLRHMSDDPWAVGQYVEKALARGAFDEALLLVQKSSAGGNQVVVAWNHLIDYQFQRQQLKHALKLYNDMKKRGQLPNARTFTVMFRGLAKSQHPKQAVAEAVKHYNVLLNDKRLEPNSIHLNAVLNVCARAGDLENMFLIANSVNESTRSPTAYTYTTIFNALRHHSAAASPRAGAGSRASRDEDGDDLPADQKYANAIKVVERAKGLWEEVVRKWFAARIVIDEELVCSMGRLLLASPRREDKRQIFDLLEQTMKIPNLVLKPELGTAQPDESMRNIAATAAAAAAAAEATPEQQKPPQQRGNAARPHHKNRPAAYAVPGRNTLALVLTTLSATRQTTAGIKYWNLMVRHYGVVPDRDNWLRLLGMLKVARSSAHAASIVDMMPDSHLDATAFRIAMETCVRDNLNRNSVANANAILDSMLRRLEHPDLHAMRLYLRVALVSHVHLRSMPDVEEAKRLYGVQITESLARLWDPYKAAHYRCFKASDPSRSSGSGSGNLYNEKREVIALARQFISAFDKVTSEHLLPEKDLRDLKPIAAKINREVQSFFADRETREPNLPSSLSKRTTTENDDDDDLVMRQGSEWVWDTYRPPRREPEPRYNKNNKNNINSSRDRVRDNRGNGKTSYPWEPTPSREDSIQAPQSRSRPRSTGNYQRPGNRSSSNDRRDQW